MDQLPLLSGAAWFFFLRIWILRSAVMTANVFRVSFILLIFNVDSSEFVIVLTKEKRRYAYSRLHLLVLFCFFVFFFVIVFNTLGIFYKTLNGSFCMNPWNFRVHVYIVSADSTVFGPWVLLLFCSRFFLSSIHLEMPLNHLFL